MSDTRIGHNGLVIVGESYVSAKAPNIVITAEELDRIAQEYGLTGIMIHEYDSLFMSGTTGEIEITDLDMNTKRYKLPKKMTVDRKWVIGKINTMRNADKAYINLSKILKGVVENTGKAFIYPTSYGIGFHTLFQQLGQEWKDLLTLLDDHGVQYRTEWSEGLWVARVIISKSKDNIAKIMEISTP